MERMTGPSNVELAPAPIKRFRPLVDGRMWSELEATMAGLRSAMAGQAVWNVNSTARGGGVAEMLAALIPYSRGAGIDERWVVVQGAAEFFEVTKTLHNFLHGVKPAGVSLGDEERRHYEQAMAANSAALLDQLRAGDVAILQDPQTAGLIPALKEHGVRVIWRSHIGVDTPNDVVREAWAFLSPYLAEADALVFSRQAYVWDGLDGARVEIIPPCIDPFAVKNQELGDGPATAILRAADLLPGRDGQATFRRSDGSLGTVQRPANLGGATLPDDARIVLQVSRWDRLKDPAGVMEAFASHVAPRADAWLVLAGPAATSVQDDPEQPKILEELASGRQRMAQDVRERVVIAQLPMDDTDENAAMVNALQRRADVVVQKSLAEGFGLTVAEAMWKARPVVASRVGGIGDQIEDGRSGVLIDDPHDGRALGDAVVALLGDRARATALGREARRRVASLFITPRHLIAQGRLITKLVSQ
jgi:trehalose synthase